jgi:2-methylcitrate dehydratase PrpD
MRFSVPYLIAARLCRGSISLGTLDQAIVSDPQVMDLAGRVQMSASEEYERVRPARNPAKVTLHLQDGQEVVHEVMNCLGDPRKPMSREALVQKFLGLAGPVLGKNKADDFVLKFQTLESVNDVRPLLRMLRPGE